MWQTVNHNPEEREREREWHRDTHPIWKWTQSASIERVWKLSSSTSGACERLVRVTLWNTNRSARSSLVLLPKVGSGFKKIWPSWKTKSLDAWTTSVWARRTSLKLKESLSRKGHTKLLTMGFKLWDGDRSLSLAIATKCKPMTGKLYWKMELASNFIIWFWFLLRKMDGIFFFAIDLPKADGNAWPDKVGEWR